MMDWSEKTETKKQGLIQRQTVGVVTTSLLYARLGDGPVRASVSASGGLLDPSRVGRGSEGEGGCR